ncbi:hypothetical protein CCACVL1_07968 [Corchorus capsularis]|uniref:Uncharacterized protein n=1 Tax=Corchorus capsularis TaxID=210143 RepID=A0A1R3J327_COCAP|nr:hypothetical protein CCACVL1_07968 [Corchorus capsularis]
MALNLAFDFPVGNRIYCDKKVLLVKFGRTWVSKTQCRRFKSYGV